MEGSFEYTEKALADSRQGVILQFGRGANNSSKSDLILN